jgi:aspartokinase
MTGGPHTSFERRRGVTSVHVRDGVTHFQVVDLPRQSLMPARLEALAVLRDAGVGIDFLKLTPDGFTFAVQDEEAARAAAALSSAGCEAIQSEGRTVISVQCVNVRDEAGVVARIAEAVTATGTRLEQVGDCHDCILLVVEREAAQRAVEGMRRAFGLEGAGAD